MFAAFSLRSLFHLVSVRVQWCSSCLNLYRVDFYTQVHESSNINFTTQSKSKELKQNKKLQEKKKFLHFFFCSLYFSLCFLPLKNIFLGTGTKVRMNFFFPPNKSEKKNNSLQFLFEISPGCPVPRKSKLQRG